MKKNFYNSTIFALLIIVLIWSCEEKEKDIPGSITMRFEHRINHQPLIYDSLIYVNKAGNPFMVNEIQYFISRLDFFKDGKAYHSLPDWNHYVDTDIESTWTWKLDNEFELGDYDSIAFNFGFDDTDNASFMFTDPPESNMLWPEPLGGGYHYMKLNGKWQTANGELKAFNFHMGRGQQYQPDTAFIDNSFRVSLPGSAFNVSSNSKIEVILTMNIENWFQNPHTYNFDLVGGQIMQNQEAMNMGKENGQDVFSVEINKILPE
jgi:hypothetical protein